MSYTKAKIYNVALSALLLSKQVIEVDTDKSTEVANLNLFYDIALESTLQDLDLDSLSQPISLELLANITAESGPWDFVYKYPTNCAFLRRLETDFATDTKSTHLSKRTGLYNGQKAIFTNEDEAVGECIPFDVPLEALSPMAGLAVSYMLAYLSAPLIVGKGAKKLRESIRVEYGIFKLEAQETDSLENFNYEADWKRSEFVEARLS